MAPSTPRDVRDVRDVGDDPESSPNTLRSHAIPISPNSSLSPSRPLAPPGQGTSQPPQMSQRGSGNVLGRPYRDREDPEMARERQRQQDIESAMSMSRARSGSRSMGDSLPTLNLRPSQMRKFSTSPIEEGGFPMITDAEEREIDHARSTTFRLNEDGTSDEDDSNPNQDEDGGEGMMDDAGTSRPARNSLDHSSGYDSHAPLLPGRPKEPRTMTAMTSRSTYDFGPMEEFAAGERQLVGTPDWAPQAGLRRRSENARQPEPASYDTTLERTHTQSAFGDDEAPPAPKEEGNTFHRRRQRKLSQSNPLQRRQGKLALFEGFGNTGAADADDGVAHSGAFKAPRPAKNMGNGGPSQQFLPFTDDAPGHDRPYRFSFYSNALPVTIHARTLAELPAEGQTFEDLFKGKQGVERPPQTDATATDYGSLPNGPNGGATNGIITGDYAYQVGSKDGLISKALGGATTPQTAGSGGPGGDMPILDDDPEAATWWLDVLSPTDDEMRMLSKVFGIHPLTTEDILLEETREKIELFRHYYLVCFRSFDQDPYSQTYLEPLNMYIIVFREGTLSFHFRGTPHPQNVRRRIKHLKDYISVTSDWISYALIDDITDAFGPLIQSIEYEVDSIDELVLILKEAEQSDMLRRIGTCRKKVMGLLRLMGNKADVVKGLAKRCNEQWLVAPKSDIGLYLSDIQDHLITMTQNLNHYEKILSRSHSNYLAQISIEMTDANNQINDVLSKLTALGTVLIPMNLVTGLWGMNVHVPGQDIQSGYAWFGGIVGALALFAFCGAFATWKCFVR